ncbi:hypothetical protein [Fusobacterium pseudoperiodonticum]|uniref:Uncharacterized protein n=1 Tax=Fusobacterium pseudoperiodonticum TaxID=2663009 RepID=A0A2G9EEA1_9FUSO|nr:hypothetical protein [Fusobacterium pseudoperiodonticum]PIM79192.1 hypothetical protein CTM71_01375 [Fusobacterium pseudoperiodonticum]
MWGYENDEQFYEYAITKVLEHKSDELEQKEFNKLKNMIDKKETYIFKKKVQEISEAKKRVIKKILKYEKLDDRDYSLIKTNIEFFDLRFKKVRGAVI